MSVSAVKAYLKEWNLDQKVLEFPVSSATVELAALAVGCEPARIAKTLSFLVEAQPVLIVTCGDMKIDNSKYKACFGAKAKMLASEEVEALIGHSVGGVCPFALKPGVRVFLDESIRRFDSVYPACGSSNSAICMTPEQLETCSGSTRWVDVCKAVLE